MFNMLVRTTPELGEWNRNGVGNNDDKAGSERHDLTKVSDPRDATSTQLRSLQHFLLPAL